MLALIFFCLKLFNQVKKKEIMKKSKKKIEFFHKFQQDKEQWQTDETDEEAL